MPTDTIRSLQDRTDAKLDYAGVHLQEILNQELDGGKFDLAHQESFLFHLCGTRNAFLWELNEYYAAGVARTERLTPGMLYKTWVSRKSIASS